MAKLSLKLEAIRPLDLERVHGGEDRLAAGLRAEALYDHGSKYREEAIQIIRDNGLSIVPGPDGRLPRLPQLSSYAPPPKE
jgi:hypothetical protein